MLNSYTSIFLWALTITIGRCFADDFDLLAYRQSCVNGSQPLDSTTIPRKFGFILFRAHDTLDVNGPLEVFQLLSFSYQMELLLISQDLTPITTEPLLPAMNKQNSSFYQRTLPTHTVSNAPDDLDVIFVPGGPGSRNPNLNATLDFVQARYPKLKYLITVCTGSGFIAQTTLLDGKHATTNKAAWASMTVNKKVLWQPKARWVVDGNIWTSSGVSAGIDMALDFVACHYGEEKARNIVYIMEYNRQLDPRNDPFAQVHNVTGT